MYLLKSIVVAKGVGSLGGASSLLDEGSIVHSNGKSVHAVIQGGWK